MSLTLDFHPDVRKDLRVAHQWYEEKRRGLGQLFLNAVEKQLTKISMNPQLYGFIETDFRQALLSRYPYAIYYQTLQDRIYIVAVYQTSRDDSGWLARIAEDTEAP